MSTFIYPEPEKNGSASGDLIDYNYYDSVNVTWETPGSSDYSLQLLLLWAQNTTKDTGGDFIKIINETVPLNGSRIISMNNGLTYPAVGFFSFQYVYSNNQFVLPGVNSQGFNITKSSTVGKVWSGNDTSTSNTPPLTANATGPAPSASQSASSTSTGLSGGAIAGIVVGVALVLIALFASLLFILRRRWKGPVAAGYTKSAEPIWMQEQAVNPPPQKGMMSPLESGGHTLRAEIADDRSSRNELPTD